MKESRKILGNIPVMNCGSLLPFCVDTMTRKGLTQEDSTQPEYTPVLKQQDLSRCSDEIRIVLMRV